MAEPFSKPNKEQIKNAIELYGDPILYWATNVAVKTLNKISEKGFKEDLTNLQFKEWIRLTRLMFLNIPAIFIYNEMDKICYDIANKQWTNFRVPNLNKENIKVSKDTSTILLKDKIKITDIAKKYGIKVKNNKALCPFHEDKDPSLSLSNEKGLFHCFGCNTSGDIIKFIQMLEEIKNGK